jgi:two-component system, NarL family, response regulator LiaR
MSSSQISRLLRVVLADEDAESRRLMRSALEAAGVAVVAGARSGLEAVRVTQRVRPDVLLVDLGLGDLDGVEVARRSLAFCPTVKVVVLADRPDEELGMQALRAGAVGFLPKTLDRQALPRIVRGVMAGEAALSREMTLSVVERLRKTGAPTGLRPVRSVLTAREWEVLDLLCEGLSTSQLADRLVLSPETVRSHVKSILRKLGVSSRAQAVVVARKLRDEASGVVAA